jgi:hypothetical protein
MYSAKHRPWHAIPIWFTFRVRLVLRTSDPGREWTVTGHQAMAVVVMAGMEGWKPTGPLQGHQRVGCGFGQSEG